MADEDDLQGTIYLNSPETHRTNWVNHIFGCIFSGLGVVLLSLNTLLIKLNPHIPIAWFIFGQGVCLILIQCAIMLKTGGDKGWQKTISNNWKGILVKLTVMFLLLPTLFRIISEMPFGDLSVITTCGPNVLIAIFAYLFFAEKLTKIQAALIILSTVGVVFIIRPPFFFPEPSTSDQNYPYRLPATLAAVGLCGLITAQVLAVRKMGFNMDPYMLNVLVGVAMTLSGIIYQLFISTVPLYNHDFCSDYFRYSSVIVLSSAIGSFISPLEALALQRTKAAIFSSIMCTKVVLDYAIQSILFPQDAIYWTTILGASVITITAFNLSLRFDEKLFKWVEQKRAKKLSGINLEDYELAETAS